jgi:hypothetical protein
VFDAEIFDNFTNGFEVKRQRNALSVIEPPTDDNEDDDLEFEDTIWHGSDMGEIQFGMLIFGIADFVCVVFDFPQHQMTLKSPTNQGIECIDH